MFDGEKTFVFWIGLIILGLASVVLFGISWMIVVWNGYGGRFGMLKQVVPVIVGGVVFIIIGLYMMMCGVKKSFGGGEMKREITVAGVISILIVSTVLGFHLWRWSIPKLYYNVVGIPMNEPLGEEEFHVVEEVGKSNLVFDQRLETYRGAESLLRLEMDIEGNVIIITETYDSEEADEQICQYDIYGRIEPLQEGTYTIKVIFIDKHMDKTETLHQKTVTFKVIPD